MWPWFPKPITFDFGDIKILRLIPEHPKSFPKNVFWECSKYATSKILNILEKTGLANPDDLFKKFLEILDMWSVSIKKHEVAFMNLGNFETFKTWKFENLELWNIERNFETLNLEFLFSMKGIPPPLNIPILTPAPAPLLGHEWTWGTRVSLGDTIWWAAGSKWKVVGTK